MSQTLDLPIAGDGTASGGRWMAVIFNDDHTPFDAVIDAIMRATGCDAQEAGIEAWEAHTFGKAPVHFADRETCERVAEVISSIGVKTEVVPEWAE